MKTELYKVIKVIDINKLDIDDLEELLRIFMVTKNALIRNHIALIFSDLHYNEAIPYVIKKINEKSTINENGTLVYSLEGMDTKKYFISFIKIICEQGYEARLQAYEIVEKFASSISSSTRKRALKILENCQMKIKQEDNEEAEGSALHYVELTIKLLCFVNSDVNHQIVLGSSVIKKPNLNTI